MRGALLACAGLLAVACIDFGLEDRRYRCDGDPGVCGEGWSCGPDGFCVRGATIDAGGEVCGNGEDDDGDDEVDCQDLECGASSCDDRNVCTEDTCPLSGVCENTPRPFMPSCGQGCVCSTDGTPQELSCGDGLDNDLDGATDCDDPDCAESCV